MSDTIDLDALDKAELLDLAARHEVPVTKSWGAPKIRAALAAAGVGAAAADDQDAPQPAGADQPAVDLGPPADPPPPGPEYDPKAEYRARHSFGISVDHVTLRFEPGQVIPEHLAERLVTGGAPVDAVGR